MNVNNVNHLDSRGLKRYVCTNDEIPGVACR
jgi:hypothetical protein